ncbi:molybdopterin-binding protein [Methylorubrum aminovorans]
MGVARIGILTVSDCVAAGLHPDVAGPAIRQELGRMLATACEPIAELVPNGIEGIRDTIVDQVDVEGCDLVFARGGEGPGFCDLTPKGTEAACERMMPGFGELLRMRSLGQVPDAFCPGTRPASGGAPWSSICRVTRPRSARCSSP